MSRRPRIVLEAYAARAQAAGVAGAAEGLVQALAARDHGLDFVLAVGDAAPWRWLADAPGWTVAGDADVARGGWRKTRALQLGLPRLCARVGADALHVLQFVAPRRLPCPLVVSVNDLAWWALPSTVPWTRRLYYRWRVPAGLSAAAAVVAISEATAAQVRARFPAVAPRVAVVPLATPAWVSRTPPPAPGTAPARPYFLFVGTREPRKNLPRLLAAYARFVAEAGAAGRAPEQVPDLVLAGGRGWSADGAVARAQADLGERLQVAGYVSRTRLRALYHHALALVFPSLLEGFGLPILEAMAAGTAVLTSRGGATEEVAGGRALLVDPRSEVDLARGLHALAWDEAKRRELAQNGPGYAATLTWDAAAERLVSVYRAVLSTSGGK